MPWRVISSILALCPLDAGSLPIPIKNVFKPCQTFPRRQNHFSWEPWFYIESQVTAWCLRVPQPQDRIRRLSKTEGTKGSEPITLHVGCYSPHTSDLQGLCSQTSLMSQQLQSNSEPTVSGNGDFMVNRYLDSCGPQGMAMSCDTHDSSSLRGECLYREIQKTKWEFKILIRCNIF